MFSGVSLDQAPPFEAPLLFFLTAPIFAIFGAALILIGAGEFAILHAFTIGFLASVMIGALLQMLPVVVGVKFERPKLLSATVFAALLLGLIALVATLGFGSLRVGWIASASLLLALGGFALITIYKLFRAPRKSDTVIAMILSLFSLLIATLLGAHLLGSIILGKELGYLHAHGAFAAFGWVGLLIVGVSYQVIPMFYITQELPPHLKRWLAPAIFAFIILYALTGSLLFFWLINAMFLAFAIVTVIRLHHRKRTIQEPTVYFWQAGLASLATAAIYSGLAQDRIYAILFGYGFAMSVIYGMLYKIVPFLSWFHISSRGFFDIPTMKEMLEERLANLHLILHLLILGLLMIYPLIAAILIVLENLLFLWILKKPIAIYFRYKNRPSPLERFSSP